MMDNRIYQGVTRMVAGMQEYTAMEALHGFIVTARRTHPPAAGC